MKKIAKPLKVLSKHPRQTALGISGALGIVFLASSVGRKCQYTSPVNPSPYATQIELYRRMMALIDKENRLLAARPCGLFDGWSCIDWVAGALAASDAWGLPPELVFAIAAKSSNFNPSVDEMPAKIERNERIGALGVRPLDAERVGMPLDVTDIFPTQAKIAYSIQAGLKVLDDLYSRYGRNNHCAVVNAYRVGIENHEKGVRDDDFLFGKLIVIKGVFAKVVDYAILSRAT